MGRPRPGGTGGGGTGRSGGRGRSGCAGRPRVLTPAADGARRVVLLRHGRTAWNADGRFQGQLDPPLDTTGSRQAAEAGAVLAAWQPTRLVTSDSLRAVQTAAAVERPSGLVAARDPRLREVHLGGWQGLTREEVQERFPEEHAAWVAGQDVRRGGGETMAEVGLRAWSALAEAVAGVPPSGLLLAVTHGATARAVIGTVLELSPAQWWRLAPLGNCRWSVLVEGRQGWRLAEHNAGVTGAPPRISAPDVEPVVSR